MVARAEVKTLLEQGTRTGLREIAVVTGVFLAGLAVKKVADSSRVHKSTRHNFSTLIQPGVPLSEPHTKLHVTSRP